MRHNQTRMIAMVAPLALFLAACGSTPSAAPVKATTTSSSIHKVAKVAPVAKVKADPSTTTTVASTTTRPVATSGSSGSSAPSPNYTPPTTPYVPPTTPVTAPPTSRCSDSNPPAGCSVTAAGFTSCSVGVPNPTATEYYSYSDGSNLTMTFSITGTILELHTSPNGLPLPVTLVIVNDPANPSTDRCGTL